jgi:hypothetical protein
MRWIYLAAVALSIASQSGCRTSASHSQPVRRLLADVPIGASWREIVSDEIAAHKGELLVTVHTSPEWHNADVRVRSRIGDCVRCDAFVLSAGGVSQRKQLYEICDAQLCEVFFNLQEQAAMGFRYVERVRHTSNPGGAYIVALGSRSGLTVNEGGEWSDLVDLAVPWGEKLMLGEDISNTWEIRVIDSSTFGGIAVYVNMAIYYFVVCTAATLGHYVAPE